MDKINIEHALKIIGYELTESDYPLIMEAASVCISVGEGDVDSSLIDMLSDEKKKSVGLLFCVMPMDPDVAAIVIDSFLRIKKLTPFI